MNVPSRKSNIRARYFIAKTPSWILAQQQMLHLAKPKKQNFTKNKT